MIIVIACDVPLAQNNGTAVAATNLINSLRSKGHTVRVLCPDTNLEGNPDCFVTKPLNLGPLNNYVRKNGVVISRRDKEATEAALKGADALHVITPFLLCSYAAKQAVIRSIPVTAGFHCQAENFSNHIFMMNCAPVNKLIYKLFYRTLYRRVDCIHYPTQFIKNTFEQQTHKTPNGLVISNGVGSEFVCRRTQKPDELKDKFVILFTGRYSKEKSHHVLIRAISLSKYADRIVPVFAGDGPLREEIEELCSKYLKNPPVLGFHPREELIDIINYADLYVHPAEIEIEAIACLEAIKCGLVPLIADSPRSATRYFALDEKNLFHFNDSQHLAEQIDYWLANPSAREERSRAYLGYTAQFDRDECMDRMENMILEAMERRYGA